MKSVDRRVVVGLCLLVSLSGTLEAQGGPGSYAWDHWRQLSYGEQMSFVSGVIAGSYGLALVYMADNEGLGGPSLFDYAPIEVWNTDLWTLIERVYQEPRFRDAPIVAIILNWRQWAEYLRR